MPRSLLTLLAFVVSVSAAVINGPADHSTIQAGVDGSAFGDF